MNMFVTILNGHLGRIPTEEIHIKLAHTKVQPVHSALILPQQKIRYIAAKKVDKIPEDGINKPPTKVYIKHCVLTSIETIQLSIDYQKPNAFSIHHS